MNGCDGGVSASSHGARRKSTFSRTPRTRRPRPASPHVARPRRSPGSRSRRATVSSKARFIANRQRRAGPVERGGHLGAVVGIDAVQYGATEPSRLERVVPALRDQRSADKGNLGHAKQQPQFAERVRQIDFGIAGKRLAAAAPGDAQSLAPGASRRLPRPRAGWRGAMISARAENARARPGLCAAAAISSSPGCVLAAIQTGRWPIRLPQRGKFRRIGRQGKPPPRFKSPTLAARRAPSARKPRDLLLVLG